MSSPSAAASALSPASPRLKSIDVFRGATIAAMILVNGQFSHEDSYRQLAHAAWNGWTFADMIFPCFLFIVGVSLTLSTASRVARGEDRTRLLGHAVRRSLLIFGCGVVIDYLRVPVPRVPFHWASRIISSSRASCRRSPSATSWPSSSICGPGCVA